MSIPLRQELGDDHARSIDAQMKFLPGAHSAASILDGGPLAFADDGQPGAVDHEMNAFSGSYTVEPEVEVLADLTQYVSRSGLASGIDRRTPSLVPPLNVLIMRRLIDEPLAAVSSVTTRW